MDAVCAQPDPPWSAVVEAHAARPPRDRGGRGEPAHPARVRRARGRAAPVRDPHPPGVPARPHGGPPRRPPARARAPRAPTRSAVISLKVRRPCPRENTHQKGSIGSLRVAAPPTRARESLPCPGRTEPDDRRADGAQRDARGRAAGATDRRSAGPPVRRARPARRGLVLRDGRRDREAAPLPSGHRHRRPGDRPGRRARPSSSTRCAARRTAPGSSCSPTTSTATSRMRSSTRASAP